MRCSALVFSRARRSSNLRPSPPASVCFDIFLLPGASAVATHVERLSSNETNKVAQSLRLQVCDYLTIGEELGKQSEPAEDCIGCRTILFASRFSSMPTMR